MLAAGAGTAADAILRLAGLTNVAGQQPGCKRQYRRGRRGARAGRDRGDGTDGGAGRGRRAEAAVAAGLAATPAARAQAAGGDGRPALPRLRTAPARRRWPSSPTRYRPPTSHERRRAAPSANPPLRRVAQRQGGAHHEQRRPCPARPSPPLVDAGAGAGEGGAWRRWPCCRPPAARCARPRRPTSPGSWPARTRQDAVGARDPAAGAAAAHSHRAGRRRGPRGGGRRHASAVPQPAGRAGAGGHFLRRGAGRRRGHRARRGRLRGAGAGRLRRRAGRRRAGLRHRAQGWRRQPAAAGGRGDPRAVRRGHRPVHLRRQRRAAARYLAFWNLGSLARRQAGRRWRCCCRGRSSCACCWRANGAR